MNFQQFLIGGYLSNDPESRYSKGGMQITNFSVAVNRKIKDKPDEVLFMPVTAFDKAAKVVQDHFAKGKEILVEGYLREEKWDDKTTGAKRSRIVMIANRVHFVGKKNAANAAPADELPPQDDELPF